MGTNQVDVDEAALTSAARAAVGDLPDLPPPVPAAPGPAAPGVAPVAEAPIATELTAEQIQLIAERNAPGTVFLIDQLATIYAPNWALQPAETEKLGQAVAVAMAAWFPSGAIPIKYAVLLNLGGTVYNIAKLRRDPKTGEFKPLRLEAPAPARGARDGAAAAA